jgi:hypothetical protein
MLYNSNRQPDYLQGIPRIIFKASPNISVEKPTVKACAPILCVCVALLAVSTLVSEAHGSAKVFPFVTISFV